MMYCTINVCTFVEVEAALLHLRIISLTFAAFQLLVSSNTSNQSSKLSLSSPYINIADRITFINIIMRINILALAAIVQLSSLPFASAEKCWKNNDDYGCGAGYQEDGYFNIQHTSDYSNCKCCCRSESGDGYHEHTCESFKSNHKGCDSCMGERACYKASSSKIGDNSCVNQHSCRKMKDSFIKEHSCRSVEACAHMERTHVGTNSCGIGGKKLERACQKITDCTIGDNSCQQKESCSHDGLG